jgi:hypothetical protein
MAAGEWSWTCGDWAESRWKGECQANTAVHINMYILISLYAPLVVDVVVSVAVAVTT